MRHVIIGEGIMNGNPKYKKKKLLIHRNPMSHNFLLLGSPSLLSVKDLGTLRANHTSIINKKQNAYCQVEG